MGLEEIRLGDAGVSRDGHDGRLQNAETPIQFEGEQDVGEFGLLIGAERTVAASRLQVFEVHAAPLVSDGGDGDDARAVGRFIGSQLDCRHEQCSEGEVADDVGAELQLESVGGLEPFGRVHDTGVVDEDVERAMLRELFCGGFAHGGQRGEIELHELGVDSRRVGFETCERSFAALPVTAGEDDVGAFAGELECSMVSDAAVGSRDEDSLAGERGDLCGLPLLAHTYWTQVDGTKVANYCELSAEKVVVKFELRGSQVSENAVFQ